jgi:glycosyltransferase involved in cell wall biosynthesis
MSLHKWGKADKGMTGPHNLLFVVDNFAKGGAAVVVYNLIKNLNRAVFNPLLCCLDEVGALGEELKADGIKVFWLNRQPGTDWGIVNKLKGIIKQEAIDLVHAHQYTAYFYGGLAAITAGLKKLIFTEHGRHYPDQRKTKRVLINKLLLPFTARIVAVSPAVKQSLITYEGMPGRRIEVVFNGIDVQKFRVKLDVAAKKGELGIPAANLLCGMIARLGMEKDQATIIKAIPKVAQKYPHISVLLIGDGPKRSELEALARKLEVADKVIFTGNRRDIPQLLAILDVVLLSTFYEGTSITLLEAMAAAKPVVASRVGGNPAVLEDKVAGFLVPPVDPDALADSLLQLLEDAALRRKMGCCGLQIVKERFGLRQMVANYENMYNRLLN